MKQPTILEKREKLSKYCIERSCTTCPIDKENPAHTCGIGYSYNSHSNASRVSNEEVKNNYEIVFGKEEVNHPSRYSGECSLECIEVMRVTFGVEAVHHFCLCNAFKYMWRYKNKNGKEDISKANWYLNYFRHDIELGVEVSAETKKVFDRLYDLWIDITDKISNEGVN